MEASIPTYLSVKEEEVNFWFKAASVISFPANGGACIRFRDMQIAIFHFARRQEWYACQNLCPHKMEMVLGRGMIGEENGEPKVACPLHKRTFSLLSGENLNADLPPIATYPVKVENGFVYVGFRV